VDNSAQQLERARHLARVEIALVPHQVLEPTNLIFVSEQHELARLGQDF
jgi:hypothetical protein